MSKNYDETCIIGPDGLLKSVDDLTALGPPAGPHPDGDWWEIAGVRVRAKAPTQARKRYRERTGSPVPAGAKARKIKEGGQ